MFREKSQKAMPGLRLASAIAAMAAFALIATGAASIAATVSFKAELSGSGEVPPNKAKGTGSLKATLDTATRTLTWTASHSGLSATPIGAHFHGPVSYVGATSEENAPIQVGTPGNLASPFSGSTTITETQAKDLLDGRWYFNIHTPAIPSGEIRGPVVRAN
jgi:hypothetical protein